MNNQEQRVIILERDVDEDRYVTPEHYIELINTFQPLSKYQFYFMMLAETGWRPHEVCRTKIDDFNFDDPNDPRVKWRIGKPTTQRYFGKTLFIVCPMCKGDKTIKGEICSECNGKGKLPEPEYLTKAYKVKNRKITVNFARLVQEYIKLHALSIGESGGYLFPSRERCKGDSHIDVTTMQTTLHRQRKILLKKDPIKYSWVNEPFKKIIYPDGRVQEYKKLSLYAFRKLHATTFARELLDRGYTDILLVTAQHMGHTNPRTTMRYVKQLIDERPIVNHAFRQIQTAVGWDKTTMDKHQSSLTTFGFKPPV